MSARAQNPVVMFRADKPLVDRLLTLEQSGEGRGEMEVEAIEEEDATGLTARITAVLEQAIREHPTEWVWMHRRWKTRPDPPDAADSPRPGDPEAAQRL